MRRYLSKPTLPIFNHYCANRYIYHTLKLQNHKYHTSELPKDTLHTSDSSNNTKYVDETIFKKLSQENKEIMEKIEKMENNNNKKLHDEIINPVKSAIIGYNIVGTIFLILIGLEAWYIQY
ncbi:hypothetical protein CE11_00503 [Megavirus courdo11]|uniref:Uncharacterized protein n=2 Tax=Megavirus TaxID=3044761 RepID=K7Y959_9VIRU|nr:hypothetical protein c7_L553 [Megavirus courdo7]AFX92530.1 hypothetical protein CE11_00503 [Megavirus courdo11]AVL93802.1 hypothetical protein mvi_442 [Megavirus vitis]